MQDEGDNNESLFAIISCSDITLFNRCSLARDSFKVRFLYPDSAILSLPLVRPKVPSLVAQARLSFHSAVVS